MKTIAIIPAGGKGKRINSNIPKQYLLFNGKELIAYTIDVFQKSDMIDEIIIPAQREYFTLLNEIKSKYSFTKISKIVEGGQERQLSVFNAVKSINPESDDLILVHDAVRPFLSDSILKNVIEAAINYGSAITAIKAKDTLVKASDEVKSYIDRTDVFYIQTPQVFKYKIFLEAIKKAEKENFIGTDESTVVHNAGYPIKIVEGSSLNFKITTEDDLRLFELLINNIEQ